MKKNPDLRVVFDTNVWVSGLLMPNSIPAQATEWAKRHATILVSRDLLSELKMVLSRRKFDRYLTDDERNLFLIALVDESIEIVIGEHIEVSRDPKDNHVLELAVSGQATTIVSRDKDLLTLHPFRDIPVLNPADFLARYNS